MSYKKYTYQLLTIITAILVFIVALNYFINPYNIFKQVLFEDTLLKADAKLQERVTKPISFKIDNRKISTVFFGTSRVDLGIDKNYYKKITGKEAENIAIGGLLFYEMFDILDIALKIHPEIENIYIGLDYRTFLKNNNDVYGPRVAITKNPKLEIQEIGISLLCLKTTGNSFWTIIKNIIGIKQRMFYSNGTKYVFENKDIGKFFEHDWIEYNYTYKNNRIDVKNIEKLKDFYNNQKALGRNMVFFIMPSHVTDIYLIHKVGNWEDYQKWKKLLVQIAPIYDFQYPNIYTTDRIKPDIKTFFDASHATYLVCNKIIEDIVSDKGNFARLLKKDNVDKYMDLELLEIMDWEKNNQEIVSRINQTIKEGQ